MNKVLFVSIFALSFIFILFPSVGGQVAETEFLFNQAMELANKEQYEKAIELFDQILKIIPEQQSILNNKGSALLELERYEEAIQVFDLVLKIYPDDKTALNNKSVALIELEMYEQAIALFNVILESDPENETAIENRKIAIELIGLKSIKNSKYVAWVQVEIRNSDGVLVGFFENDVITFLSLSMTDEFLDTHPILNQVSSDGKTFEVRKIIKTILMERDYFFGGAILQSTDTKPFFTLFFSSHNGFTVTKNDIVNVTWTILREIS